MDQRCFPSLQICCEATEDGLKAYFQSLAVVILQSTHQASLGLNKLAKLRLMQWPLLGCYQSTAIRNET